VEFIKSNFSGESCIMCKLEQTYWHCYRWFENKIFEPNWYRFFGHKFHIVKTKLVPRSWYDTDTRMLYAVMELVRWFVDNDQRRWSLEDRKEEIDRINKEVPPDQREGFLSCLKEQWETEDGIVEIANWWKNYPNREKEIKQALDTWHTYVNSIESDKSNVMHFFRSMDNLTPEQKIEEIRLSEILHKLEENLLKEETQMLVKAVELRLGMWS